MNKCNVLICRRPAKCRGLCKSHYQCWYRGDKSIPIDFGPTGGANNHRWNFLPKHWHKWLESRGLTGRAEDTDKRADGIDEMRALLVKGRRL